MGWRPLKAVCDYVAHVPIAVPQFVPMLAGTDILWILDVKIQTLSESSCCPQSLPGFSWSSPRLKLCIQLTGCSVPIEQWPVFLRKFSEHPC